MCRLIKLNKEKIILILSELVLIFIAIINSFIKNILSTKFLTAIIGLIFLILFSCMKLEKDNPRYVNDSLYTIAIISSTYYIFIYLLGLITGFYNNLIHIGFWDKFKNVIIAGVYIIASEMFRFMVATRGKKSKSILILLIIALSLCDTSDFIYKCNFGDISDTIDLISYYIVPCIIKNIALTYLSIKISYKSSIFYRIIIELPYYFLPFFPDTGQYFQAILNTILPTVLLFYLYSSFKRSKNNLIINTKLKILKIFIQTILLISTLGIITLVSGFFKYHLIVIGSESMTPKICKGDAVIVHKINKDEIKSLKEGDILVFRHSNIVMVHRIVDKIKIDGECCFRTKGDYNVSEDSFTVYTEDVIGKVNLKISKIGIPTVWLKELSNF